MPCMILKRKPPFLHSSARVPSSVFLSYFGHLRLPSSFSSPNPLSEIAITLGHVPSKSGVSEWQEGTGDLRLKVAMV